MYPWLNSGPTERVTFAIDFVTGKGFHPRTRRAPVQDQLVVLDLDVYLPQL